MKESGLATASSSITDLQYYSEYVALPPALLQLKLRLALNGDLMLILTSASTEYEYLCV